MKPEFRNIISFGKSIRAASLKETVSNWMIVLTGLLIDRGMTAIALILVARQFPLLDYGSYTASYGMVTFLIVFPNLGLDSWLLAQGKSKPEEVGMLWKRAATIQTRWLLVWFTGIVLLSVYLPHDTYPVSILVPSAVGAFFDCISLLAFSALRCRNLHTSIAIMQGLGSTVLFAIVAAFPDLISQIYIFAVLRAGISVILAVAAFIYLSKKVKIFNRFMTMDIPIWSTTRHFLTSDIASVLYTKADINIIGLFIGSIGSGIYGPALNILQITFLAPRALFLLALPRLAEIQCNSKRTFTHLSSVHLGAQLLIGAVSSLILFLFAHELITIIFGEAYVQSGNILLLLSPIPLLRAANFGLGANLAASQNQAKRSQVQIGSAVFNILANLIAVFRFGLIGVAIVYILSEIYLVVGYSYLWFRIHQSYGTSSEKI